MIFATGNLGNVDVLEVIGEAIVERFEAINFALNSIELREALAEIQRFGFPFFNVGLKIFHLLADGLASRLQFFEGVGAEKLNQLALLRNFIVELDDLRVIRPQIFSEGVALGLEKLDLLLGL